MAFSGAPFQYEWPGAAYLMMGLTGIFGVIAVIGGGLWILLVVGSLLFGKAPLTNANRLFDAVNPIDNFFNSSRSALGAPVSVAGDLPQLTGAPASMSSFDLDVVDITNRVTAGQTSADIRATSNGDVYLLGGFVTSISRVVSPVDQAYVYPALSGPARRLVGRWKTTSLPSLATACLPHCGRRP